MTNTPPIFFCELYLYMYATNVMFQLTGQPKYWAVKTFLSKNFS